MIDINAIEEIKNTIDECNKLYDTIMHDTKICNESEVSLNVLLTIFNDITTINAINILQKAIDVQKQKLSVNNIMYQEQFNKLKKYSSECKNILAQVYELNTMIDKFMNKDSSDDCVAKVGILCYSAVAPSYDLRGYPFIKDVSNNVINNNIEINTNSTSEEMIYSGPVFNTSNNS